jgi:type I restriction enzyme M protein
VNEWKARKSGPVTSGNGANIGYEAELWLLVQMLEPYKRRVYDPCCGSSGMFVQSEKFIEAHGDRVGDISIYGQESNYTTWRLARMNLAIRGIDGQITHGDTSE